MIRTYAFSFGLQAVLVSSFALAQSTLPSAAPLQSVAPITVTPISVSVLGTATVPAASPVAPIKRWANHHEPSTQEKCGFELRELAHHLRGVDAMVSRDGSSISINIEKRRKMGSVDANPVGLGSKVEIFGRDGKSSVDGMSCSFDKTKRVGDGAAKLIEIFQNQEKVRQHPMAPERQASLQMPPNNAWAADREKRHHDEDFAGEFLNHVVQQCSQVYPQVEALRTTLNLPATPLPQAQAAVIAPSLVK